METREKRIGAHTYRVTLLGAKAGRAMLVRLVKLGGPGVGAFVSGVGRAPASTADLVALLTVGLGEALHDLAMRLREDEVGAMMDEFAALTVVVKSTEIELRLSDILDEHFAGKYDEMLAWTQFCLEVNFSSFFVGTRGFGARLERLWKTVQALSVLQPPPTSTGTSTASPPADATARA